MKPKSLSREHLQAWGAEQAISEFGDTKKAKLAAEAFDVGINFAKRMPVGWNIDYGEKEFASRCETYVTANYKPKPYGFFMIPGFGWLFWQLISALITWAVSRLVNVYFPKNDEN